MKGAGRVVGIDIDEWAYNNAHENPRINNTNDIMVAGRGRTDPGIRNIRHRIRKHQPEYSAE